MFFINEKSEETTFEFLQNLVKILKKYLIKMETQKIVNLLHSPGNEYSKFATKKWYVIDTESKGVYSNWNPIKFLTKSIEP